VTGCKGHQLSAASFKEESAEAVTMLAVPPGILRGAVGREGGENNLTPTHTWIGLWFVCHGRARFYTTADELVAAVRSAEGVLILGSTRMVRKSSGEDELEILQVEGPISLLARPNSTGRSRSDRKRDEKFGTETRPG